MTRLFLGEHTFLCVRVEYALELRWVHLEQDEEEEELRERYLAIMVDVDLVYDPRLEAQQVLLSHLDCESVRIAVRSHGLHEVCVGEAQLFAAILGQFTSEYLVALLWR